LRLWRKGPLLLRKKSNSERKGQGRDGERGRGGGDATLSSYAVPTLGGKYILPLVDLLKERDLREGGKGTEEPGGKGMFLLGGSVGKKKKKKHPKPQKKGNAKKKTKKKKKKKKKKKLPPKKVFQ